MTDRINSEPDRARAEGAVEQANIITPLPGEPGIPNVATPRRSPMSRKGLLAVGLLTLSMAGTLVFSIHRVVSSGKTVNDDEARLASQRPTAATSNPRRLDLLLPAATGRQAPSTHVPALVPTAEEAQPIGVRRTGLGAPPTGAPKGVPPEDAPVLLVTSRPGARNSSTAEPARQADVRWPDGTGSLPRDGADPVDSAARNLQGYQRQLQGLLDSLSKSTAAAAGRGTGGLVSGATVGAPPIGGPSAGGVPTGGGGLFGGQLQGSATPRVAASMLGNRSLVLPKGTAFTCTLKTQVISATSGLVGCQVQRNVFSDDGRVLLIERGSHLDGEYRIASVRSGTVRIPVLWTRIRTPLGVTIDIDSPGTGQLGESGIDSHVDNRWAERIGAAMLLSLIDDSVKLVIQNQSSDTQGSTVVLPSTTSSTSKLAEKVLDSTINIPPLIYQNQGGIVGIYVARDVDFSSVYELQPTDSAPPREATR
jgi:type IV secretion system protein VirB10